VKRKDFRLKICEAFERNAGSAPATARELGIHRATVYKALGMQRASNVIQFPIRYERLGDREVDWSDAPIAKRYGA
jgi:predicted DNA-binding transcriptional regulator AlpA